MGRLSPSRCPSRHTGIHATLPDVGGAWAFDHAVELPRRRVRSWTTSGIARSLAIHSRADKVRRATLTGRKATHYGSSRESGARNRGRATRGVIDRGSCEPGSPASAPPVPATGSDASRQCGRARAPATSAGGRPSGPMERARVGQPACRVSLRGQRGHGRGAGRLPLIGREERS